MPVIHSWNEVKYFLDEHDSDLDSVANEKNE